MFFGVNNLELKQLTHETVTGSEQHGAVDTANYVGNIVIGISVQAGGTGTSTVVIQDSADGSTGWNTVDAEAIVSTAPATAGEQTTLATLTTSAGFQTVGLRKDLIKRYIRLAYSGGTTHAVAAFLAGQKKYTEA